jgi:endoglucanase
LGVGSRAIPIGAAGLPIEAFAHFSNKVAAAFAGNESVYALSLMNELHDSNGMWKQIAQAGLNAVRKADREPLVIAPGDRWSEASKWQRFNDDFLLDDPSSRTLYKAHQYFDVDHTGTYKLRYTLSGGSRR